MRFTRHYRPAERGATPRRLAAAQRAIRRQLDRVPLFPELVPVTDPAQRIAEKDREFDAYYQKIRDHHAALWRRNRRTLRAMPVATRQEILDHWNIGHLPGDPVYLAELIRALQLNPNHLAEYRAHLQRAARIGRRMRYLHRM